MRQIGSPGDLQTALGPQVHAHDSYICADDQHRNARLINDAVEVALFECIEQGLTPVIQHDGNRDLCDGQRYKRDGQHPGEYASVAAPEAGCQSTKLAAVTNRALT